jgi:RNA polymerase sigma-70 factor, ECF subfamily
VKGPSANGDVAQIASDPVAFEGFYLRHVDAVQRFVVRRVDDPHLAAASRISGRALVDADDLADLVERIDAEARARRLYEAMGRLSNEDRDLFELVALDGLAVRDAARLIGVSQAAARLRLHRARQLLRNQLAQPIAGLMDLPKRIAMKEASP